MSSIYDRQQALRTAGDDIKLVSSLLELFYEEYTGMLQKLRDAFSQRRKNEIMREAHSLNGALQNIGGMRAARCAIRVEKAGTREAWEELPELIDNLEQEIRIFVTASRNHEG